MTLLMALGLLPAATRAADWQLAGRLRAEMEVDDNPGLVAGGAPRATTAVFGAAFDGSRRTETEATALAADLALRSTLRGGDGRRADGRLSLSHEIQAETESWSLGLGADAGSADRAGFGSADVLLGNAARRSRTLSAGWLHRFSDRWSGQVGASWSQAGFSGAGAADYRERGASAQVSHALDERSSASLSVSSSAYRSPGLGQSTASSAVRLGWNWRPSETSALALTLGRWRSRQAQTFGAQVCPLPAEFCLLGLVDPIVVPREAVARSSGGSGTLRWDAALDERSTVAARVSRDLSSGGAGVRRTDALSLALQRALDDRTDVSLRLDRTTVAVPGVDTAEGRLRTLGLQFGHTPATGWRLGANLEHRRSDTPAAPSASGRRLLLTLEVQGPRLP